MNKLIKKDHDASETPRTDAYEDGYETVVYAELARQLERELTAMTAAKNRAVRLLDEMYNPLALCRIPTNEQCAAWAKQIYELDIA